MKKMKFLSLALIATAALTTSCSSSDGGETPTTVVIPETYPNSGGDGFTFLTPDAQKAFISETGDYLKTFFVADEFKQMSDAAKTLNTIDADVLEDLIENIFNGSRAGTVEYYEKVIRLSALKGQYSAQPNSKVQKVSDEGNFTLTLVDNTNSTWVLGTVCSGVIAKDVLLNTNDRRYSFPYYKFDEKGNYIGYEMQEYGSVTKHYMDIPQAVNVVLTCNGVEKVNVSINITKFAEGKEFTLHACTGSARVALTPATASYIIDSSFSYEPYGASTAKTTLSKGGINIITAEANAMLSSGYESVTSINSKVDILGRIQVYGTCPDGKSIADAYNNTRFYSNKWYDESEKAQNALNAVNNGMNIYMCNNKGTAIQGYIQHKLISEERSYNDYQYNPETGKYENVIETEKILTLTPVINFSDGSSYALNEYFGNDYFMGLLDFGTNFVETIVYNNEEK